jgi:predicted DNA-binding transcriptional regulator AlpA
MIETDLPLLVDAKTLAKLLSISPATVWCMLSVGKLPSPLRPSPGIVRWPTEEIRLWVNEGNAGLEDLGEAAGDGSRAARRPTDVTAGRS